MAKSASQFEKKNANLVVIGSGKSRHFEEFRKKTGYKGRLLSDPSRQAFTMLGFSRGITGLMSIKSISRVFSAVKGGHKQGAIQGNTLQLGGAIIVDPSYTVDYFFASKKAGDHPAVEDLIAAVDPKLRPDGD